MIVGAGTAWAEETLTIGFEEATYTDWTLTTIATKQTNSNVPAHSGSFFGNTGGKTTGSVVTKEKIASPKSITFYVSKQTTNTTASSWLIKVSSDGTNWTQVGDSQSASSGITRGTWTEVSRDLSSYSDVYVGVFYDGTAAIRCIDDIAITYEKAAVGPVDLTSFAFATTSPSVTLSKNGNNYEADYTQTVTVDPTDYNGDITYTIENSTFDTNDVIINYNTGKVTISTTNNVGGTIVVKASGQATAAYNKPADATYTLTVNAAPVGVGTPTFSLTSGAYYYGTTVEIEAVNSTLITYTTDGTTPTMESTTYSVPVAITKTMTLKAKAWDNESNESEVASINYTLKAPEAPTFSVEGGEVIQGSTVTLTPGEGGSVIVYTTDGTTPTIESDIYEGAITINAAMTIKAATVDDGENLSAIASFDFTVKKVDVYEKVTDASTLAVGDQLLLVYEDGNLALGTINSGSKYFDGAAVTISDSKITDPSASVAVLTLDGDSEAWTLQSSLDSKYLSLPNSSNELRQSDTADEDNQKWTISIHEGVASVTNVAFVNRVIKYNSGSPRFACYTSGQKSLALYRLQESLEDATITIAPSEDFELNYGGTKVLTVTTTSDAEITATSSNESVATVAKTGDNEFTVTAVSGTEQGTDATITFAVAKTATYKAANATIVATVKDTREAAPISFAEAAVEADMDDTFKGQALTNDEDLAVTWDSSDKNVATVANDGTVTLVAEGTTTITASFAGNATYKAAVAQYELTVTYVNRPGSSTNPYTVAQARAAIDAGTGITNVYATGKISQIDGYNSTYNSITYWISADGNTMSDQLEVYSGKGLNNANFSAVTDLQVGDVVVVFGTLKKYNDTYEFDKNNYIVSRTELPASDLTKTSDIVLDFKNGATDADLTDYFTTSSTGAITYTVADETVIENADELISALKVGTTTVTVSQAATLSYKAGEITINVTVQDTREAATTIPAINIETLKVNDGGTLSVTNPVKADEGVTFSFASSDDNVLMVENGEYLALAVGTVTVTVTATPSNTNLYKPVVANFEVTVEADVKTNTEIAIDDASGSTVYGTPKNVDFIITDGYNGELSYTIDNAAIADVEIGASAITFTPKAVGIAVITISAPETATFNAAENVQYTLTVTAPEGSTEAAVSSVILFNETFDKCEGSGGRDGEFTGNVGTSSTTGNLDEEWTTIGSNGAYQCIKLGTGKATGSVETSNITLSGSATLTFSAAGWGDTSTNTIQVSAEGATLSGDVEVTLANGVWNSYTVNITEATGSVSITFTMKRGFLDDVVVTKEDAAITAKLNASGYATFCSQYPLDFTTTNGYTAWQIKAISGETITFEKIKGAIKGGQGILLKGEADATVTLASEDALTMLDGNLLYGITAPTYVADDEYLGLSGNKFVKINAGTVPAGKALLPASAIPAEARELTFVFEDEQTTGIESLNPALSKGADTIYDLQGRKVAQPTKGLYIKNGKKVVMK